MRDLLFHPAFQSVGLPGVLSVVGLGMLLWAAPTAGRRWASVVAVLALAASLALLPGWHWPAGNAAQKLPWILAGGLGLAIILETVPSPAWAQGSAAALGWALASQWVAGAWAATPSAVGTALAGAALLACLIAAWSAGARSETRRFALGGTWAAATLTVASLGLAGLAAFGGSLLLAQLAAMLATVSGVLAAFGLWSGLQSDARGMSALRAVVPGPVALMPLGLAWLTIAQVASLSGVGTAHLGVLALAVVLPLLVLKRWGLASPNDTHGRRWAPVFAALAAAVPTAAAIGWQVAAPAASGTGHPQGMDDPYYEPRWK